MKKITILSAGLMASALAYGAFDFVKSNSSGQLNGLYTEPALFIPHAAQAGNAVLKKISVNVAPAVMPATTGKAVAVMQTEKNNSRKAKPDISLEEFSRAPLIAEEPEPEPELEPEAPVEALKPLAPAQ